MARLRFGIVGCGVISEWHAVALGNLSEDAILTAVCDTVPERAHTAAARWGARPYNSIETMLDDDIVDAVIVGTHSGLHADQALLALERGKHVVIEKPIDVSLDKANRIVTAARESGLVVTPISQN